ncbi:MAG TPA: glycoside hydrolase family 2 TIM barrel-domain containing protein [Arachidicoccus sp.]|nr:glycoside hydrolase family 2 TIM barrel-domain containing protein [Arachidicoccus sp.]
MCRNNTAKQKFNFKFFVLPLLFCSLLFQASGQKSIRLTDNWQFLKSDLGSIWEAWRPATPGSPQSVPLWQSINLPHCFNARDAVDPDVNYYQGPGWYRTRLSLDNPYQGGHTYLHFEGAGQKTKVYIDTILVGEHVGGYDMWTVDITAAVAAVKRRADFKGQIPLAIRCDNSRDVEMIPSDMSDFNLYGGLYRYVDLVYEPAIAIQSSRITPVLSADLKTATIDVQLAIRAGGPSEKAEIQTEVLDPGGKAVANTTKRINLTASNQEAGRIRLPQFALKSPAIWSPAHPQLYTVITTLRAGGQVYTKKDQIGFRNFEFKQKGPFFLNGQRLLLRGTHRHEDHAGLGAAMTENLIRREMILIKEMGANFIRLAHYQQSPIVLRLCDSLGLLVWEEIPWCRGGLGNEIYQAQGKAMLTHMIEQHYNHPSVIIWGMGNEIDWPGDFPTFEKTAIRTYLKSLNELAHQLDPSRKTGLRRCDFASDLVDIYSPSIWAGWYRGIYTEYKSVSREEFEKVPRFIHIEWGADSHAGRHSESPDKALSLIKKGAGADERAGDASLFGGAARASKDGDWSETYACNLIDWHLKEQETMPWLTGAAYWIFKDFSTPLRPDNPVPYVNQKGVVERDLTKKEAYFVFQSYWTKKPMAHIYGHSWPIRWGDEGEEKMVKVYSNCDQAELFINGVSMGSRKRNSQDFPAAGLRWQVPMKAGHYRFKVIATKDGKTVTDQLEQDYQSAKWAQPAKLVLEKLSQNGDTTTLQVKLYDQHQVMCLDGQNIVHFSLAGDGQLLDDLGTSSGSRKVQLYNGRAEIRVIRPEGNNIGEQRSALSVQSKNLPTAILDF